MTIILSCLTSNLKIKSLSQKQNPREFRVLFLVKAFLFVCVRLPTLEYIKSGMIGDDYQSKYARLATYL